MATPRKKYLDPDFRPNMHGIKYPCCRCQKELTGKSHRMVHVIDGGFNVLHPADEHLYKPDNGDMYWLPIGSDCAKKLGLEWSVSMKEIAA